MTVKMPQDNELKATQESSKLPKMPTRLADRFTREGSSLFFESERGQVILSLNPSSDLLDLVLALDGSSMDASDLVGVKSMLAEIADSPSRIGLMELLPVFERWTWELAAAMNGVSLPESDGSATA